jgi:flavin-dependent dehydrogenase
MRRSGGDLRELDVAIVGGGLAGNLLARQLRLAHPELRIGLFEKATGTSYKVGEATVEMAANYLVRKLGLSTYLYENHLPKNGLRYFFDDADRGCALERMSEIGTVSLPFHPAFQLDRARLEADLLDMNRCADVHVRTGARVYGMELGSGGAAHRFQVDDDRGTSPYTARWVVDAAGRSGFLARPLDLRTEQPQHRMGAVWGRFENVADIDRAGTQEFHARVRHTPRRLSTIHFMYRGYWIWFIPLRGGIISVGLTSANVARDRALRTSEGFRQFLDEHAAIRALLSGAKLVDIGSYARIAYGSRRFFHPDRWGLTGEAATAADPLYSPGSDFIALENDFLGDLITRDLGGERAEELAERIRLYDAFMKFRHEAAMLLYTGLYDTLGCYELSCIKWYFDIGFYYNLWASEYMRDQHLDLAHIEAQFRLKPFILQALQNFADLFRRVASHLEERGSYHRGNVGRFRHGLTNIDFTERVGADRSEKQVLETSCEIFNRVRAQSAVLLGAAASSEDVPPLPMSAFLAARPDL